MVRFSPICCRHNRHRPCDKVKVVAFLTAMAAGFTLLEMFYTEMTPIRKYVTPSELYVSNAVKYRRRLPPRSWSVHTTTAPPSGQLPVTERGPIGVQFKQDNGHGVEGIFTEVVYKYPEAKARPSVGIGCAITCRKLKHLDSSNIGQKAPIIRTLLSSFCKTASVGFEYHFYLTYDHDDPYFAQEGAINAFIETFMETAKKLCAPEILMELHLKEVLYHSKPAWAQNDAMMEAYLDGMDYMYRLNDDVQLMTRNWTYAFVETLRLSDPPEVGVVGPAHLGGNEAIITLDFVHRKHVEVFGFYYPRKFTDWFADDWITGVYQPRAFKLHSYKAVHTYEQGTRYNYTMITEPDLLMKTVTRDKQVLNRYLEMSRTKVGQPSNQNLIISMSLYGNDPRYTIGAIRNAQLAPVIFPGWTLRVYVEKVNVTGQSKFPEVPFRILDTLRRLGAQIVQVDPFFIDSPPMMWRFLILDDNTVDYFIVRDSDSRLTQRDADSVRDWMRSGKPFHCVRDHPSHASAPVFGGLWGGRLPHLRELIRIPMTVLMKGYKDGYYEDVVFIQNAIWPKVNRFAYCHDSVACNKYVNSFPFPFKRNGFEFIGGVYDEFGELRHIDIDIIKKKTLPRECSRFPDEYTKLEYINGVQGIIEAQAKSIVNSNNEISKTIKPSGPTINPSELTVKPFVIPEVTKIYTNVVVWSTDLNTNPIRGIKSLLTPLGVEFIDKSLAPDCKVTNTCAQNLKIVTKDSILNPTRENLDKFTEYYKDDPEMKRVTHVLCSSPAAVCEYYMHLKKTLIILVNERYESGREDTSKWEAWNRHLSDVTLDPKNVIAANNHYDVEYLRYFTGMNPEYLPPYCGYTSTVYKPTKPEVLLSPALDDNKPFITMFMETFNNANKRFKYSTKIAHPSTLYSYQYTFDDIAAHPAIVYVPNQVSMFSACEHYIIGIPLFFPSLDLLTQWHLDYGVISNLTLNRVRQNIAVQRGEAQEQVNQLGFGSPIQGVAAGRWDPNNEKDSDSIRYWLRFADFYQLPHITHYESIEHLVFQLNTLDFGLISRKMLDYTKTFHGEILKKWVQVIDNSLVNRN